MRAKDINSVIDPIAVKGATDGCFIAYHRKSDGFQSAVPYWSWPALEKQGEIADGVLVLIDGQAPIIVSPTETQMYWSKNAIAVNPNVGVDYSKAYVDYSGKTRTAAIMAKGEELFGEEEETWKDNYAPAWCNAYDRSHEKSDGSIIGLGAGKWWFPSIAELVEIWKHKYGINVCLSVISGASQLTEWGHWSSTEYSATAAWYMGINDGCLGHWYREVSDRSSLYVRAVTTFHNVANNSMLYFPQDNNTYGFKNGIPEIIAGADEAVLVYTQPSATTLALQSLESGKLEIDETTKPEIVEEMKELLGEELFNELSANNFSTLELKPQIPEKEQLKQAIDDYYKQKEFNLQYAEEFSNDKLLEQK